MNLFLRVLPFLVLACAARGAEPERRREWQPVQDYFNSIDPVGRARIGMEKGQRIKPFLSYPAVGTESGVIGPDAALLAWKPGHISVELAAGQQAGVWHALTKRGKPREPEPGLDFQRCYPPWIEDAFQPSIKAVRLRGSGHGKVKVQIKTARDELLWSEEGVFEPAAGDIECCRALPPLNGAKYLNWFADTHCELSVDQIALELEMPALPADLAVFLKSYAKLSMCYSPEEGMVADRAHIEAGSFDCVPASGMFCLATAAALRHGIVSREFALALLRRTHGIAMTLDAPFGVLPHFIRLTDGRYHLHPGTEYSVVDTSIYYHSMLLAARLLDDEETLAALLKAMRRLDFSKLRDAQGRVVHGLGENREPLPFVWQDWGGETALVLLLQRMVAGPKAPAVMHDDGIVWMGTGFVAEIQSLFYPQFDRTTPDRVTGQVWPVVRSVLLEKQRAYFRDSPYPLARTGLYGLSAGEERRGAGYLVSGVDLVDQRIVHPHYILMSGGTAESSAEVYAVLAAMQKADLFPPFGLPENIDLKTGEHLPMLGSLNASFETLSAFHLMCRHRKERDPIYEAAENLPPLREAIGLFYPN